jgi:cytochrome c peroxidase
VRGLNDALSQPTITATCTTCHDDPNVGNHSTSLPLDLGISDPGRCEFALPVYTFQNKMTGEKIQTTDPGRALITGKWKHINVFKGPILRGLAARPPYFHNGCAKDLNAVVDFYNNRFNLNLTDQQKQDLVAFLRSL